MGRVAALAVLLAGCACGAKARIGDVGSDSDSDTDTDSDSDTGTGTGTGTDSDTDTGSDPCAGAGEACYEGPDGTRGVGDCADGTLACQEGALVCADQVLPVDEECNGEDDDCDGEVDGAAAESLAPCLTGLDGPCGTGRVYCIDQSDTCIGPEPAAETCANLGVDDDCDGNEAEGPAEVGAACDTGLDGICADGENACVGGALECTELIGVGDEIEVCGNGDDEDCDGEIDEVGCSDCPLPDDTCVLERNDGHCYFFCPTRSTWDDARTVCSDAGYHLLSITDATENDWADTTGDGHVGDVVGAPVYWWMGLNDVAVEGTWEWEDGDASAYRYWHPGEPNDVGGEDCATLNRFDPETDWNDQTCAALNPFICEDL